jgi:hypothetical protein
MPVYNRAFHFGPERNLSGAKDDRPGLGRCLTRLQPGDTLVVWRLDRLGRSMRHLVTWMEDLRNRGVACRSVSDGMSDTTIPSGELVFHIFSALAQFERRRIQLNQPACPESCRAIARGGCPRTPATNTPNARSAFRSGMTGRGYRLFRPVSLGAALGPVRHRRSGRIGQTLPVTIASRREVRQTRCFTVFSWLFPVSAACLQSRPARAWNRLARTGG